MKLGAENEMHDFNTKVQCTQYTPMTWNKIACKFSTKYGTLCFAWKIWKESEKYEDAVLVY